MIRKMLENAGLPTNKNIISDVNQVTDLESSSLSRMISELDGTGLKVGLVNIPEQLKSFLKIFHEHRNIEIFPTEKEAVNAFNQKLTGEEKSNPSP